MINSFFEKANVPEDMPIENPMITKQIEFAQSKVEGRNFAIRKHILSYDDVMNIQRDIIYTQRRSVLDGENIRDNIVDMINEACEMVVDTYRQEIDEGTLNKEALINEIQMNLNIEDTDELHKDKSNQTCNNSRNKRIQPAVYILVLCIFQFSERTNYYTFHLHFWIQF